MEDLPNHDEADKKLRLTKGLENQIPLHVQAFNQILRNKKTSPLWFTLASVMAYNAANIYDLPQPSILRLIDKELSRTSRRLRQDADPSLGEADLMRELIDLIRAEIPALEHAFGDGLPAWIRHWTFFRLSMHEPNEQVQHKFLDLAMAKATDLPGLAGLLPDNPAKITPDGQIFTPPEFWDDPKTPQWERDIRNYVRALRPERKKGRPKKSPADKQVNRSKHALDPEKAAQAFKMKQQRKKNWQIARALYPHFNAAECRSNWMRKRIDRLVEKAGILAAKKKLDGKNRS